MCFTACDFVRVIRILNLGMMFVLLSFSFPPAGYQGYQGGQYYQGIQGAYGQGAYPNSSYPPPDGRGYPPPGPPNHQSSYQANYQQPPGSYQRPSYPPPGQPGFQQDQYPVSNGHLMKVVVGNEGSDSPSTPLPPGCLLAVNEMPIKWLPFHV